MHTASLIQRINHMQASGFLSNSFTYKWWYLPSLNMLNDNPRHALTPCQRLMKLEYCPLITTYVPLHMYKLKHTSWKLTQLYSFYIFYIIGNSLCLTIFRSRRYKYLYCTYYPEDPLSAGSLLTWRQYTWREVWNKYQWLIVRLKFCIWTFGGDGI